MKLLIINNVASGYGEGAIYDFVRSFVDDGDEVVIRTTDGTTDLRSFLDDAADFDAVVASGGDGTVAGITYHLADSGVPILPFPAGTANLLALNLLSPTEPHALAALVRAGNTMDFDIGEMEFSNGSRCGFSIMAGAGYDATIMREAMPAKHFLGPMAYFQAAFANPTPQFSELTVTIDGKTIRSEGVGILIINFSKIQFDLSLVHENMPRDGMFDVVILRTHDAFGLIPSLFSVILDRSGDFPNRPDALEIYRGSHVHVEADPPLPIQYDGEVTDLQTPFTARIIPEAARFIVSDECLDLYAL